MATRREDLGSWLEGTPGRTSDAGGSGTGLPTRGSGSMATTPRRLVALAVDWMLALAVSAAFFPDPARAGSGILSGDEVATLAVFAVSTTILVSLVGHTVGHRLLGLRVVRVTPSDGAPQNPGLAEGLLRTGLLCLVIPAVVWTGEGRGLHDVAAGTVVVRR